MDRLGLLGHLIEREIRNRYLGSLSGLLWGLLHPVLLLAMYAFLFGVVFKARIAGAPEQYWLAYLALGLWPWLCFADGLQRGTATVMEHAALISKVALPSHLLVVATVAASFLLHGLGYGVVLAVLALVGYPLGHAALLGVLPMLLGLFLFTLGLAWIAAAMQVFVRDLAQVLSQIITFGFFLTPILYSRAQLPTALADAMAYNPLGYYTETPRWLAFGSPEINLAAHLSALALALGTAWVGYRVFQRLAPRFEDFL